MEQIKELMQIDFISLLYSVFIVLVGIKSVTAVFEWVINKLGLETKWMRKQREEHDLLIRTSQNLTELKKQHIHDVEVSNIHDENIKKELSAFMSEIKSSISETQSEIKKFAENRISDRQQSLKIQKELTDSIKSIVTYNFSKDTPVYNYYK